MSSKVARQTLLVLLLILALLAAACGGDGGDDTATPASSPTSAPAQTPGSEGSSTVDSGVPAREDEPEVQSSACPTGALGQAEEPIDITVWHSMSAVNGEVFDALVSDYNASQDKVVVSATYQGSYQEAFEKYVNTLRSGGDLPDVIQQRDVALQQMVDSMSIVPAQACVDDEAFDLSDFTPAVLDQYRIGAVLVALPFQLSNPVLYYDGTDLVAAGLDPDQPPRSFEDVIEISRSLVASGVVDVGMALDFDAWVVEQWVSMAGEAFVDNDNGRSARATSALLDSAATTAIYDFLVTMRDEGLIKTTGRGTQQSGLDKFLAVAFGEAAMTIGTSATLGEIYTQIGAFPEIDLRVAALPGPSGGGNAVGGGALYLMEEGDDVARSAGWDFMKWLNEPAQQIVWSAGTGYIPTRQSAYQDPALQALWEERPGFRVAAEQLAAGGPIPGGGGPVIGDHDGVRDAVESSLEALFAGTDARDAQRQALEAANEAIEDYNRRIAG